jgi:prevent-host-death family protein
MRWQVQEAKQRFSEVVRRASAEGPQVVTRHGHDVVVVVDAVEFKRLTGGSPDFKAFLATAPDIDALEIERSTEPARVAELGER